MLLERVDGHLQRARPAVAEDRVAPVVEPGEFLLETLGVLTVRQPVFVENVVDVFPLQGADLRRAEADARRGALRGRARFHGRENGRTLSHRRHQVGALTVRLVAALPQHGLDAGALAPTEAQDDPSGGRQHPVELFHGLLLPGGSSGMTPERQVEAAVRKWQGGFGAAQQRPAETTGPAQLVQAIIQPNRLRQRGQQGIRAALEQEGSLAPL